MSAPPYDLSISGSWQRHCTAVLQNCIQSGVNIGPRKWLSERRTLRTVSRVIIADGAFSDMAIQNYNFKDCYFIRNSFERADLSGCNFSQSIIVECSFNGSIVYNCNFSGASLRQDSQFLDLLWNNKTALSVKKGALPELIDSLLRDEIQRIWIREEFQRGKSSKFEKLFAKLIDHGHGFAQLSALAAIIVIFFSALFFFIGASNIRTSGESFIDTLLNSARYFLALSDPYEATNIVLSSLGIAEAGLGLIFLALIISSFMNKIVISK